MEVPVAEAQVISLMENAGRSMTCEEGLAFVARSRRQLDRFSVAFPNADDIRSSSEFQAEMRLRLDKLERNIRRTMADA
jgi:hypothetical protein